MDLVDLGLDAEQTRGLVDEVVAIRDGVKTDDVGAQQSVQQPLAPGQRAEHLGAGKGTWRKKPMRAVGSRRRTASGTSMSW